MDTLAIAQELRATELPQHQADAIASAIGRSIEERAATKTDLEAVKASIRADFDGLKSSTRADIEGLKTFIADMRAQLLTWFIGTQVAVGALIIAIIKL